jgi:cysteine synthase A
VATDSLDMYRSRLQEMNAERGPYGDTQAAMDHEHCLLDTGIDHLLELSCQDKRRMHNLKYFTWVEQQGKSVYRAERPVVRRRLLGPPVRPGGEWDRRIEEFNRLTGLAARYQ